MDKNNRILTFSEFSKKYGKGSLYSKKTNVDGVELMKNAASKLDEPVIKGSKGDMDSVSSEPATRKIKTDYEKTPSMPDETNRTQTTTETGPLITKETVTIKKEKIKDKEVRVKPTKKIKADSKKSEEDKREEAGDY